MAICPKCGNEIAYLNEFRQAEARFEISLGENGGLNYFHKGVETLETESDFECPECHELLTNDEETASKILKGEYQNAIP